MMTDSRTSVDCRNQFSYWARFSQLISKDFCRQPWINFCSQNIKVCSEILSEKCCFLKCRFVQEGGSALNSVMSFLYFEGLKYGRLLTADTSVLLNSIWFGDDGLRGGIQTGNKSKDNDWSDGAARTSVELTAPKPWKRIHVVFRWTGNNKGELKTCPGKLLGQILEGGTN